MIEFGEQLRRAREDKGMTQQTLAEQLFVTRQAVSKWERGERYPDLPTTKKISEILDVSLDDLLSGKDMVKEVERNPVVENKAVNNMMLVLYALVVFTCFFNVVGHISALHSEGANLSEMGGAYIVELIYKFIMEVSPIIVFGYGMYQAIVGTLSPKRMGAVIVAFLTILCVKELRFNMGAIWLNADTYSAYYLKTVVIKKTLEYLIFISVPCVIGAVSAFFFYIRNSSRKIFLILFIGASIYEIVRRVVLALLGFSYYYGGTWGQWQVLSLSNVLEIFFNIALYVLFVYQTVVLWKKRRNAQEVINSSKS